MPELTQDYARELFNYRDGELYCKVVRGQRMKVGDRAGSDQKDGYRGIKINNKTHKAHRLVFLYHHGYIPEFLDHIDGNRANNSIDNLREATRQENQMNRKKNKSMNDKQTSSKFKGVSWDKERGKWMAYIYIDGKRKHLGRFTSKIDAALAYDKALIERDSKFALTNAMLYPEIFKN